MAAAHSAEVARLRKDFQQRAPYEAVLAGAKVGLVVVASTRCQAASARLHHGLPVFARHWYL